MTKRGPSSSPASKMPVRFERLPEERFCEGVLPGVRSVGVFAAAAAGLAAANGFGGLSCWRRIRAAGERPVIRGIHGAIIHRRDQRRTAVMAADGCTRIFTV